MKTIEKIIISLCVVAIVASVSAIIISSKKIANFGGTAINGPSFVAASSTKFSLTTTSAQIMATTSKRVAASIQVYACTGGSGAYVATNANNDVRASLTTGPIAFASSTLALASYPNQTPVPTGGIQARSSAGTCDAIVTEWDTQN